LGVTAAGVNQPAKEALNRYGNVQNIFCKTGKWQIASHSVSTFFAQNKRISNGAIDGELTAA